MITPTMANALTQEYYILHLIYHRSKNQHRVQKWWQYFNIFHRKLRKIVKLTIDIESSSSSSKIKAKNDQILEVIRYLIKNQVFRKAFYEYNSILALGQFINLGFALLGSLSKIYALFMEIEGVKEHLSKAQEVPELTKVRPRTLQEPLDDDFGEAVDGLAEDISQSVDQDEPVRKKQKTSFSSAIDFTKKEKSKSTIDEIFGKKKKDKKVKKDKKKKKKNDMDDIFGF